jgi:hypothetical protein
MVKGCEKATPAYAHLCGSATLAWPHDAPCPAEGHYLNLARQTYPIRFLNVHVQHTYCIVGTYPHLADR